MKANVTRIKELCKERGISVSFVCEKVGQGAYYLNDVKRRGGNIPKDRMNIIADILDTSVEYLIDETDDPAPKQEKPAAMSDEAWYMIQNDPRALAFFEAFAKMSHEKREIFFAMVDEEK